MTKRRFLVGSFSILFAVIEGYLFYLIHIARIESSHNLRYICIIVAAIFSWLTLLIELMTAKENRERIGEILFDRKGGNLIRIAMLFTLVADYYLVAMDEPDNFMGVAVFLGTQLFICLHILANDESSKARKINLLSRFCLTVMAIFVAYTLLGEEIDTLAIITLIYFSNLCVNAIFAHRIGRGGIILTVGLIFFALCDVNVGISGLYQLYLGEFSEGSILYSLYHTELDLVWFFYIPSQTLIPLTLLFTKNEYKRG